MKQQDFHYPTQIEIDAQIREAQKLRAEAIAGWTKSAARWLAHPRRGLRHA